MYTIHIKLSNYLMPATRQLGNISVVTQAKDRYNACRPEPNQSAQRSQLALTIFLDRLFVSLDWCCF